MTKNGTNASPELLFKGGAVAAILAALIFRRNIGAEISLFTSQTAPSDATGWFTLLQNNGLLGLGYLNFFDTINYVLVGVMFVVVYIALKPTHRRPVAIATLLGLVGIAVYLATNTAFVMLSLSSQYAAATSDAQRTLLATSGDTLLAMGDPGAIYEGFGGYLSLALIAITGLIFSTIMLREKTFGKLTGYVGIVASAFDLAYIVGLAFVSAADVAALSALCLSIAGLLLMVWHLLIGIKLYQLSKVNGGVKL